MNNNLSKIKNFYIGSTNEKLKQKVRQYFTSHVILASLPPFHVIRKEKQWKTNKFARKMLSIVESRYL